MNQTIPNEEACKKLEEAEKVAKQAREDLLKLKRDLFRIENVSDYEFGSAPGEKVKLSELFGNKEDLIVVHNMGSGCPYCTLWADGLNGLLPHLENRAAFVVSSPNPPEAQAKFAERRGWKFKMVSTKDTSFVEDMGMTSGESGTWPGYSAFSKNKDGTITRVSKDFFGPGDDYCSVWHMFPHLNEGVNQWQPKFDY